MAPDLAVINLAAAIVCIAAMTGLPEAETPEVRIGIEAGGWPDMWPGAVGLYWPGVATVSGRGMIWVRTGYEHMVVHELVHHLQDKADLSTRSVEAEKLATQVQFRFWSECPEAQGDG